MSDILILNDTKRFWLVVKYLQICFCYWISKGKNTHFWTFLNWFDFIDQVSWLALPVFCMSCSFITGSNISRIPYLWSTSKAEKHIHWDLFDGYHFITNRMKTNHENRLIIGKTDFPGWFITEPVHVVYTVDIVFLAS